MYKREMEEYEEAMKTYTLTTGTVPPSSTVSSPAQSTEMSMDFASDPIQPADTQEGSFMDEDDKDTQTNELYSNDVSVAWQPPPAHPELI
jgi:hypothetical protein